MLVSDDTHLTSLLANNTHAEGSDHELASLHAPVLRFDRLEPFLPLAAGFSVFRQSGPSPSFPRTIEIGPGELVLEYAIWWDWEIVHLYELEHVWVYLDSSGSPLRAEASWHGRYRSMGANGSLPLSNDRLTIFSEPGKHAFAPDPAWYRAGKKKNRWLCCRGAGTGGVLVSDLFADLIDIKSSQTDKLVQTFLREHAFVPSHEFNRSLRITSEQLVPWPQLFGWIPERVSQLVAGLRESARFTTGSLEPLACEELL